MAMRSAKSDEEEDYEVADLSAVPAPRIEFIIPNLTPMDTEFKKTKRSKKRRLTSAASVPTAVQLNSEIVKLRAIIREARFFFSQRLLRRVKRMKIQLTKKPKDTLRRKVARLEEELCAVKTIPVDDICKFALTNKNTLHQLKLSNEAPTNERCLYKLSRDPRVTKAVMEHSVRPGDFEISRRIDEEMKERTECRVKESFDKTSSSSTVKEPKKKMSRQKLKACPHPLTAGVARSEIGASAIIEQIRLDNGENIEFEKKRGPIQTTSEVITEDTEVGPSTFFLPYSTASDISNQSVHSSQKSECSKELNTDETRKMEHRRVQDDVRSIRSKQQSSGSSNKARTNIGELHPSWAARKRAKELQRFAPKGKRIVFSDD